MSAQTLSDQALLMREAAAVFRVSDLGASAPDPVSSQAHKAGKSASNAPAGAAAPAGEAPRHQSAAKHAEPYVALRAAPSMAMASTSPSDVPIGPTIDATPVATSTV